MKQVSTSIIVLVLSFGLVTNLFVQSVEAQYPSLDATAIVLSIVDGDTFDSFPLGRIRVADIQTPESGQPGYEASRSYLLNLIGGARIYLNVDNDRVDDPYHRLICVVYVRYNATHLLNVNKRMIESGNTVVSDYTDNEFNPNTWNEYEYYPASALPAQSYSSILSDYLQLQENYDNLAIQYTTLLTAYNQKVADYNALLTQYNELNNTIYTLLLSHDLNMSYRFTP